MKNIAPTISSVMLSLALTSCANEPLQIYQGPALADTETALISAPRASNDRTAANIRILSADDPSGDEVPVTSRSVKVLPRGVCIDARAISSSLDSLLADLCFDAYAGSRYEVRATVAGTRSSNPSQLVNVMDDSVDLPNAQSGPFFITGLFVVDLSTQRVVASARP